MNISNENVFFVKDDDIINTKFNKENYNICENNLRTSSISIETTFENENDLVYQGKEIDFHQDFFPRYNTIKFTDLLVDNWKERIKIFYNNIIQCLSKVKNL